MTSVDWQMLLLVAAVITEVIVVANLLRSLGVFHRKPSGIEYIEETEYGTITVHMPAKEYFKRQKEAQDERRTTEDH